MQLKFTPLLLATLPVSFTLAYTCTNSLALDWSIISSTFDGPSDNSSGGSSDNSSNDSSDNSSGGISCSDSCNGDSSCFDSCLGVVSLPPANIIYGSRSVDTSIKRRELRKRYTLRCTASESCFMYTDGSLVCVTMANGDYHDDLGGVGNLVTGAYIEGSGQDDTFTSVTKTTARSTSTTARSTSTTTRSTSTTTGTGVATTAASGNSGDRLRAGSVVGAIGLCIALVL